MADNSDTKLRCILVRWSQIVFIVEKCWILLSCLILPKFFYELHMGSNNRQLINSIFQMITEAVRPNLSPRKSGIKMFYYPQAEWRYPTCSDFAFQLKFCLASSCIRNWMYTTYRQFWLKFDIDITRLMIPHSCWRSFNLVHEKNYNFKQNLLES